jgi:radical SAM protein with 4Fe4S-binding SPASM domain
MIEYDIGLQPKRLMNLALNGLHILMPRAPVLSFPPILQIEPTNVCNLNCPLCPAGTGTLGRSKSFLNFDVYKRLIDEIGPYTLLMQFWGWGEPFLHPLAFDMIRYAKKYNMAVVTSSNMQVFTGKDDVENLIECSLDTLIVAIDGTDPQTYEKYRVNGKLDRVLDTTEQILEARERHKVVHPMISFQFTVMRHNEHQIKEIQSLSERLEVDFLTLRALSPHCGPVDVFQEFVPGNKAFRRFGSAGGMPDTTPMGAFNCLRPSSKAMLFSDGTVGPCEEDYSAKESYGRLDSVHSFRELWFSMKARDFRKKFNKGKNNFPFCKSCPYKARIQSDCIVAGFCYNPRTADKLCSEV